MVNLAENDTADGLADLVAFVSAVTARLYGQRRATRTTQRIAAVWRGGEAADDATR